jgi:hypothetical protein
MVGDAVMQVGHLGTLPGLFPRRSSWLASASERAITIEIGSGGPADNMPAFTAAALDLLDAMLERA